MQKKLIYIDTDVSLGTPGAEIDDGAAIILLLRNEKVKVAGVGSVFGNVPMQDATLNLDRLLTWLDGEDIPLGLGAARPLRTDMTWFEEWQSGYEKTLDWTPRPRPNSSADLIIKTIADNPNQVSILALGPLTNLAVALQLDSRIVSLTQEVIVMGGSFQPQNPTPEFNVRCDPEAAQIVFSAGWNVHVLGLDLTRQVHFSRQDFTSLPNGNPAVELLRTQAPGWIRRVEQMGWEQDGCSLHDAVAAAYLIDDSIFQSVEASVEVELSDPNLYGVTRFSAVTKDRPVVRAVVGVETMKCRDLIWSYLEQ